MADRLRATVAVLDGQYQDAEEPLRGLLDKIGEDISLRESLERRKQLSDRSARVSELQESLEELRARYDDLVLRQKAQIADYQVESEQAKLRTREITDLKGEKEKRERDAAKAVEMRNLAESLHSEVDLLAKQVGKLQADSNERHRRVESQVQTALMAMRSEVATLEEKCETVRKSAVMSQAQSADLEAEMARKQGLRVDAENQFVQLQNEYKAIMSAYTSIVDAVGRDPFGDARFRACLDQMIEREWGPAELKQFTNEYDSFTQQLSDLKREIAREEAEETELKARIGDKRAEINDLKVKLRELADNLQQSGESGTDRAEYTEGAPSISFTPDEQRIDRITTLGLFFGDFEILEEFVGQKPSQMFLMLQFMDRDAVSTPPVDPRSGKFNAMVKFGCENDHILAAYFEKSAVLVKLGRIKAEKKTEVGRTELVLAPFIEGVRGFASTVKIWSSAGKLVGSLTFESALSSPLAQLRMR